MDECYSSLASDSASTTWYIAGLGLKLVMQSVLVAVLCTWSQVVCKKRQMGFLAISYFVHTSIGGLKHHKM